MRRMACRSSNCRKKSISVRTSLASPCSTLSGDNSIRVGTEAASSRTPDSWGESLLGGLSLMSGFDKFTRRPRARDTCRNSGRGRYAPDFLQENRKRGTIHERKTADSGWCVALNPFFGKRIRGAPEFLQNGLGLLVSRPPMFEIASARLHRVFRCAAGLERDTEIHLDLVAQLMQGAAVVHGSAFYELPQNLFAFDDCREAKGDDRGLLEDPLQDLAEIFHHFRKV